jgi:hypothetical protein
MQASRSHGSSCGGFVGRGVRGSSAVAAEHASADLGSALQQALALDSSAAATHMPVGWPEQCVAALARVRDAAAALEGRLTPAQLRLLSEMRLHLALATSKGWEPQAAFLAGALDAVFEGGDRGGNPMPRAATQAAWVPQVG